MNEVEAIKRYEKLTYDLSKVVSKLDEIRKQMQYVNQEMDWDSMFMIQFDDAMANLANVESGAISYCFESKFIEQDIKELEQQVDALKNVK